MAARRAIQIGSQRYWNVFVHGYELGELGSFKIQITVWGELIELFFLLFFLQSMNLIISSTFLSLMEAATPSGAFGIYAGKCISNYGLVPRIGCGDKSDTDESELACNCRIMFYRLVVLRFLLPRDKRVGVCLFSSTASFIRWGRRGAETLSKNPETFF